MFVRPGKKLSTLLDAGMKSYAKALQLPADFYETEAGVHHCNAVKDIFRMCFGEGSIPTWLQPSHFVGDEASVKETMAKLRDEWNARNDATSSYLHGRAKFFPEFDKVVSGLRVHVDDFGRVTWENEVLAHELLNKSDAVVMHFFHGDGRGDDDFIDRVVSVLKGGGLIATDGRDAMALNMAGMSSEGDIATGGSKYVYARFRRHAGQARRHAASEDRNGAILFRNRVATRPGLLWSRGDDWGDITRAGYRGFREQGYSGWLQYLGRHDAFDRYNEIVIPGIVPTVDMETLYVRSDYYKRRIIEKLEAQGFTKLKDGRKLDKFIKVYR